MDMVKGVLVDKRRSRCVAVEWWERQAVAEPALACGPRLRDGDPVRVGIIPQAAGEKVVCQMRLGVRWGR